MKARKPSVAMKDTFLARLLRGVRRVRHTGDWPRFAGADWADHIMSVPVCDRFHAKQGRSIGRWALEASGERLVVYLKRHYRLPRWRGMLATIQTASAYSPALQEWDHLEWARELGLPVPESIAVGEYIGPWCRLQSFIAVKELTGMLPLHEAIAEAQARLGENDFHRWKHGLVVEMARLTRALHEQRRFHKDLYLCHFYITETDTKRLPAWQGRVRLIDFHRLAHHPWSWPWWQTKDLAQLYFSSEIAGVTLRDRLSFWRAYRGNERRRRSSWWLWLLVRFRIWRYRRHQRQR
jgi:heptose I phosphotransferase